MESGHAHAEPGEASSVGPVGVASLIAIWNAHREVGDAATDAGALGKLSTALGTRWSFSAASSSCRVVPGAVVKADVVVDVTGSFTGADKAAVEAIQQASFRASVPFAAVVPREGYSDGRHQFGVILATWPPDRRKEAIGAAAQAVMRASSSTSFSELATAVSRVIHVASVPEGSHFKQKGGRLSKFNVTRACVEACLQDVPIGRKLYGFARTHGRSRSFKRQGAGGAGVLTDSFTIVEAGSLAAAARAASSLVAAQGAALCLKDVYTDDIARFRCLARHARAETSISGREALAAASASSASSAGWAGGAQEELASVLGAASGQAGAASSAGGPMGTHDLAHDREGDCDHEAPSSRLSHPVSLGSALPDRERLGSAVARQAGRRRSVGGQGCAGGLHLARLGDREFVALCCGHSDGCKSQCSEAARHRSTGRTEGVSFRRFPLDPLTATCIGHVVKLGACEPIARLTAKAMALQRQVRAVQKGDSSLIPTDINGATLLSVARTIGTVASSRTATARGASRRAAGAAELRSLEGEHVPAYLGLTRSSVTTQDVKNEVAAATRANAAVAFEEVVGEFDAAGLHEAVEVQSGTVHTFVHADVPQMVKADPEMLRVLHIDDTFKSAGRGGGSLVAIVAKSSAGNTTVPLSWSVKVAAPSPPQESAPASSSSSAAASSAHSAEAGAPSAAGRSRGPQMDHADVQHIYAATARLLAGKGVAVLPPHTTVSDEAPEYCKGSTLFKRASLCAGIMGVIPDFGAVRLTPCSDEEMRVARSRLGAATTGQADADALGPRTVVFEQVVTTMAAATAAWPLASAKRARLDGAAAQAPPTAHVPEGGAAHRGTTHAAAEAQPTSTLPAAARGPEAERDARLPATPSPPAHDSRGAGRREEAEIALSLAVAASKRVEFDERTHIYGTAGNGSAVFASATASGGVQSASEARSLSVPPDSSSGFETTAMARGTAVHTCVRVALQADPLVGPWDDSPVAKLARSLPLDELHPELRMMDDVVGLAGAADFVGIDRTDDMLTIVEVKSVESSGRLRRSQQRKHWEQVKLYELLLHRVTGLPLDRIKSRLVYVWGSEVEMAAPESSPARPGRSVYVTEGEAGGIGFDIEGAAVLRSEDDPLYAQAKEVKPRGLGPPVPAPREQRARHSLEPTSSVVETAQYIVDNAFSSALEHIAIQATARLHARLAADAGARSADELNLDTMQAWEDFARAGTPAVLRVLARRWGPDSLWAKLIQVVPTSPLLHLNCCWHKNQAMVRATSKVVGPMVHRVAVQRAWLNIRDAKRGIGALAAFGTLIKCLHRAVADGSTDGSRAKSLADRVRQQMRPQRSIGWMASARTAMHSDATNNAAEGSFSGLKNQIHRGATPRCLALALRAAVGHTTDMLADATSYGRAVSLRFAEGRAGSRLPSGRAAAINRAASEGMLIAMLATERPGESDVVSLIGGLNFAVQGGLEALEDGNLRRAASSAAYVVDIGRRTCTCDPRSGRTTRARVCKHFCAAYYTAARRDLIGPAESDPVLDALWERAKDDVVPVEGLGQRDAGTRPAACSDNYTLLGQRLGQLQEVQDQLSGSFAAVATATPEMVESAQRAIAACRHLATSLRDHERSAPRVALQPTGAPGAGPEGAESDSSEDELAEFYLGPVVRAAAAGSAGTVSGGVPQVHEMPGEGAGGSLSDSDDGDFDFA